MFLLGIAFLDYRLKTHILARGRPPILLSATVLATVSTNVALDKTVDATPSCYFHPMPHPSGTLIEKRKAMAVIDPRVRWQPGGRGVLGKIQNWRGAEKCAVLRGSQ